MAKKAKAKAKKKKTTKKKATKKTATKKKITRKKTTRKSTTKKKKATTKKKKTSTKQKKTASKKSTPKKVEAQLKKERQATRPKNNRTLSYTQSEFVENIRGFCGLTKRADAKEICEDISLFIRDSLRKGYKIPLLGLGKMYVRKSKARMGRNPATGEAIHIPARKRVRFSVAKNLKEAVL